MSKGVLTRTLEGHKSGICCVAIGDGVIVSGSSDPAPSLKVVAFSDERLCTLLPQILGVQVWDLKTGDLLRTIEGHSRRIRSVAVHSGMIVSGSYDNTVKCWNTADGSNVRVLDVAASARGVALDATTIVAGLSDGTVLIYQRATGSVVIKLMTDSGVHSVAMEGNAVVVGGDDGAVAVWERYVRHSWILLKKKKNTSASRQIYG